MYAALDARVALNVFLPLYVTILGVAIVALAATLAHVDSIAVARSVDAALPARLLAAYLTMVACGLAMVWLGMWVAYVFTGRPTPVEPEAFKIVAALDLLWLVPSLAVGGVLLWNRRPWGFVLATAASIQGAVYLLVLSVNALVLIRRGLATAPGELPIWAPLASLMWIAALVLLKGVTGRQSPGGSS